MIEWMTYKIHLFVWTNLTWKCTWFLLRLFYRWSWWIFIQNRIFNSLLTMVNQFSTKKILFSIEFEVYWTNMMDWNWNTQLLIIKQLLEVIFHKAEQLVIEILFWKENSCLSRTSHFQLQNDWRIGACRMR